jgi:hypothetical protein
MIASNTYIALTAAQLVGSRMPMANSIPNFTAARRVLKNRLPAVLLACMIHAGFCPQSWATPLTERVYFEPLAGVVYLDGDALHAFKRASDNVGAPAMVFGAALGFRLGQAIDLEGAYLTSGSASQSLAVAPLPTAGGSTGQAPTSGDFSFSSSEWHLGMAASHDISARWGVRAGAGISFRTIVVENSEYPNSNGYHVTLLGGLAPLDPSVRNSFHNTTFYMRAGVTRTLSGHLSLTFDYSYSGPVAIEVPYASAYHFPATKIAAHNFFVGLLWRL